MSKTQIIKAQNKNLSPSDKKIVFFDGVCNLCNGVVDFTMQNNVNKDIYFASLQSEFAIDFLAKYNFDAKDLDTFYFYEKGKMYNRSDAALQLARKLKAPFKFASLLLAVPKPLRDTTYNFISKNRYRFFGKKDSCRLPTEEERDFFLS